MNIKNLFAFLLFFVVFYSGYSQKNNIKTDFWNNVRYGGSLGLNFSTNVTSIIIAPSALYQINNQFSAGLGVNFGYTRFKINSINQYNYGGSLISLYNPFPALQLSAELEHTFVNAKATFAEERVTNNFNFPSLYLGVGYRVGNVTIGARYDVLFNENKNIYASALSPFARFYF